MRWRLPRKHGFYLMIYRDRIWIALGYPSLEAAIHLLHAPPADTKAAENERTMYRQRLALEELIAHHISLRRLRVNRLEQKAEAFKVEPLWINRFHDALSFSLTTAQKRVISEVQSDLSQNYPMHRLVQGDVGSGKTVIAASAALHVIAAGGQVALMAPTELLAEQHLDTFEKWFKPLHLSVASLSSRVTGQARTKTLSALSCGEIGLLIGTQAIFQEPITFHHLGLVIIDEQHRFGVDQRLALVNKAQTSGFYPHQLIMTATPIPRTLAMTAYADLDVSVIDELPPGRQPVKTVALPRSRRAEVVARVREACRQGAQVYWVCPLIEQSEANPSQAAQETAQQFREQCSELRIGLLHGRLKAAEKEAVMERFLAKELDLLVTTTVIEVGVDVPNANLMIIEHAERLGLSQLHQLRGRVGRGLRQSHCVLLYDSPLSKLARERIAVIRETTDGFRIAERDLALRGPGEVLGTRQTGLLHWRVVDMATDQVLLPEVQHIATNMLAEYPQSIQRLLQRWLPKEGKYASV